VLTAKILIQCSQKYAELNQTIFTIDIAPEAILDIDNIAAYNKQEGLS
jgi:phosphoribosylformylglycinamidine synthase